MGNSQVMALADRRGLVYDRVAGAVFIFIAAVAAVDAAFFVFFEFVHRGDDLKVVSAGHALKVVDWNFKHLLFFFTFSKTLFYTLICVNKKNSNKYK